MAGYKCVSIREAGRGAPIERGDWGQACFDSWLHTWVPSPNCAQISKL
ncbi:hypothetical protein MPL1032_220109 [Mesorhizobium plurifarium]|uniref:Uncharacterized protein n=1 Tax=Mesorhizobium plurifarium TaxID=69974 RepID=A0A0K2VYZ8_MESPL|nr:hypothetical protein MPL1032_220109 [Mesorhizobium plurifarium]